MVRVTCLLILLCAATAWGQGVDPEGRPVAEVRIEGLHQTARQLVENQVRTLVGDPYSRDTVEKDVVRITHLGVFESVRVDIEDNGDGTVDVIYRVAEQPVLADVQVVGNKALSDQELLALIVLQPGDPASSFLIDRGRRLIREAYEDKGYFMASVNVDEPVLREAGILIFRIVEGPKVRIKAFRFEGNSVYDDESLKAQVRSDEYFPIFKDGSLSREQLDLDAARVRDFYRDRGYLEAQVARDIDLSPNQRDAVVVFRVEEGRQFSVDRVDVVGNENLPAAQVLMNLTLSPGSTYSESQRAASTVAILDLYGKLGYLETTVDIQRLFHDAEPRVDLRVVIVEGRPYTVGSIAVRGNEVTRSKVVLRQLRGLTPGTRFDRTQLDYTRRRLRESVLFSDGKVTILGDPQEEVRDVLVEVAEAQTGSLAFGAAVSSDLGVLGAIDLVQRNFDISDTPENAKDLFTGRAFRGAGQTFRLSLQPGSENSRYSVSFSEPNVLESDYYLDTSLYFLTRELEKYNEQRAGVSLGIGQRFGDVWRASVAGRVYGVDIDELEPDAPVDVFAVEGGNLVTGVGFTVVRDTTDSFVFPSRGSKLEAGLERVGALGGDFDFTRLIAQYDQFWTVDEDIFDRKTIVHWRVVLGWIFEEDEAPTFERFYAGGQSFRGFGYRGVGPRGIEADSGLIGDDPVGGDFQLLTSLEYEFPLFEDFLRGVFFTDMGTVQDDVGLDQWRVSIGAGIRLRLPFFGAAPIAIDLAHPLVKEEGDETQIINFSLSLPLQ